MLWAAAMAAAGDAAPWRLLMFDAADCGYCRQWDEEVGVVYGRTLEGRMAPLARAPLAAGVPRGLRLREPVRYTPTFVLLDRGGRELGRITGYPGEGHFWGLLDELLERVARDDPGKHIQS